MELYHQNVVLLCILLPSVIILFGQTEGAPAPNLHQRQVPESANGPDDARWRLVSGLETAYLYITKLNSQIEDCDNQEPLLSPTSEMETTLNGICELMSVQRLAEEIDNSSDLNAILQQNVLDSCNWLNLLVSCGELNASARFLELNDTCEIDNMPRLSQYCLESKLKSFYNKVYLPVSDYYSNTVQDQNALRWIRSQIPDSETHIKQVMRWTPGNNFTCPFSL